MDLTSHPLHRRIWYQRQEGNIADYVRRYFGLFTVPICIGNTRAPVNAKHAWFASLPYDGEGRLAAPGPAYDFLYFYHRKKVAAAYVHQGQDKRRIFLGIPETERKGFGPHSVTFFSKGVLKGGSAVILPRASSLAFMVAGVDHPGFALHMDREGFREDRNYLDMRDSIETHIFDFFQLLSRSDPRLLSKVMRTHSTMLLAHAQRSQKMPELFGESYGFDTPLGQRTWRQLANEMERPDADGAGRRLYVFKVAGGTDIPDPRLYDGRGTLVIAAGN